MTLQLTGTNRNGSPELMLSGGGSTTFAWSPFGAGAARTGNTTSLPGFNGERQDPLSGVTHLGSGYRAYSPALRRFTCPDSESPFGSGGINPYVYCDHDPINNTDPDGHMPIKNNAVRDAELATKLRPLKMNEKQGKSLSTAVASTSGAAGTSSGDQRTSGVSSSLRSQRALPATAVQGTQEEKEGALRMYSTNIGAQYINAAARKENGVKIEMPTLRHSLAKSATVEYNNSHQSSSMRLGKPDILEAASNKIQFSPSSAVSLMKGAVSDSPKIGNAYYYRGTFATPVLSQIKVGYYVESDFFMSVSAKAKTAEVFASGLYSTDQGKGVIYEILGNPHKLPYGEVNEKEGIFNVGTIFEFTGIKQGNHKYDVYSFTEHASKTIKKGDKKGHIYR